MKKNLKILVFITLGFVAAGTGADLMARCDPSFAGWRFRDTDRIPHQRHTHHAMSDWLVYCQGLESIPELLKAPQVLFLGNSRAQFAFRQEFLQEFQRQTGLQAYTLGFGNEGMSLAWHLIQRFDLRPRLVVIDADHFFTDRIGPLGQRAIDQSAWEARRTLMEDRVSWLVRRHLHRWIPQYSSTSDARWVIYRDYASGAWLVVTAPNDRSPVRLAPEKDEIHPETLAAALAFLHRMRGRGAEVVLTHIPGGITSRKQVEQLAGKLGLPLLAPEVTGLNTCDGSHLDEPSARRFCRAFLALVKEHPELFPSPGDSKKT